ncbi:MAG: asparaginase [Bauldia sp.]
MTKVVIVSTGGTIASRVDRERGFVTSQATGAELVGLLLKPADVAIEVDEFVMVGSFQFDLDLVFRLTRRIAAHLDDPTVAGVVVTQGTDTMEESAFMADLLVGSDKPLVFTGAQRHADEPDSDGPRNLSDAIKVAAALEGRGLGAVIVFEQEIHAARDVTKVHAARVGTFASGEHGKLGEVDGERVIVHRRPTLRQAFAAEQIESRVDLVKLVMGSDGRFIDHAVADGARAIVLEAFGRGNATPAVVDAVRRATERGVLVVVTTRCPQGRVAPIYGNGGGTDLVSAGAVFAGDMSGIKARILLAVLLAGGRSRSEVIDLVVAMAG